MSKPSDGPWSWNETGEVWTLNLRGHNATIAVTVAYGNGEGEANARLIAAAPDLLAALEGIRDQYLACMDEDEFAEDYPLVVAALAKARGEA